MVPADFDTGIIVQVGEQFTQTHPPYKVSVLSVPMEEQIYYEEKLVIMLVARDAPEIIFLPYDRFLYYAQQDALTPLEDVKQAIKDIVPYGDRLEYGVFDQTLYGVPHPSKAGLFAIISISDKLDLSKKLLLDIINAMPYTPNIDDKKAAPPPTFFDTLRETAEETKSAK
jgi:ABC-type glycerol-3-phosphate transport system substrate-binding protein